jgi:GT2 family glycosyltransferase
MDTMLRAAGAHTRAHAGQLRPLHTAAFFCVMMPRHVYEKVGELDEAFGIGMFEDDDYCRRVQKEGWDIACAEDVFIHHHLSASFSQIKQEKRQAMFEANKAIYEAKWGPWTPHSYRKM